MKNRWTKTAVLVLIAVLVMSLGAIAAFAQDDGAPPAVPFGRDGFGRGFHGEQFGRGGIGGVNDEALAEALGITLDELNAARQKAAAERLAQAVEEGYLTKDQANLMIARQALRAYLDQGELLAQALGMTKEEFQAAHEDGSLHEKLAEITADAFQENIKTAVQTAIQQAVTDKAITQDQADLVLEQLKTGVRLRGIPGMRGMPGMHGRSGGHHGYGGGHGGYHGVPQPDDAGEAGEAFSPFRNFGNAPAFGA